MNEKDRLPTLIALHPDFSLNALKLAKIEEMTTDALLASLLPGRRDCLKTRPDSTILDGHHRIYVLRQRGVAVDLLPREVIQKEVE